MLASQGLQEASTKAEEGMRAKHEEYKLKLVNAAKDKEEEKFSR